MSSSQVAPHAFTGQCINTFVHRGPWLLHKDGLDAEVGLLVLLAWQQRCQQIVLGMWGICRCQGIEVNVDTHYTCIVQGRWDTVLLLLRRHKHSQFVDSFLECFCGIGSIICTS